MLLLELSLKVSKQEVRIVPLAILALGQYCRPNVLTLVLAACVLKILKKPLSLAISAKCVKNTCIPWKKVIY